MTKEVVTLLLGALLTLLGVLVQGIVSEIRISWRSKKILAGRLQSAIDYMIREVATGNGEFELPKILKEPWNHWLDGMDHYKGLRDRMDEVQEIDARWRSGRQGKQEIIDALNKIRGKI